jgi:hypothetical protein
MPARGEARKDYGVVSARRVRVPGGTRITSSGSVSEPGDVSVFRHCRHRAGAVWPRDGARLYRLPPPHARAGCPLHSGAGTLGVLAVSSRATSSMSCRKSSIRKWLRPLAMTTKGSTGTTSVQPAGKRRSVPAASWKYTRSSPHVCRQSTSRNVWPVSGWNGWVIRRLRVGSSGLCAVGCSGQRGDQENYIRLPEAHCRGRRLRATRLPG